MVWAEDGCLISISVADALAPVVHLETYLEPAKLEKKVNDYFKKGGKNLAFRSKAWNELVEEYADNAFGSLFCGLGDRHWIHQADFLLVVDAGVKELFPAHLFQHVSQERFERVVCAASDRAFDDQRYLSFRWEVVQQEVQGKTMQKRVRDAMDAGRAETARLGLGEPDAFVQSWVRLAIEKLRKTMHGEPQHALPPELCRSVFERVLLHGGLPGPLLSLVGTPPPGWPVVADAVREAYAPAALGAAPAQSLSGVVLGGLPLAKRHRGRGY